MALASFFAFGFLTVGIFVLIITGKHAQSGELTSQERVYYVRHGLDLAIAASIFVAVLLLLILVEHKEATAGILFFGIPWRHGEPMWQKVLRTMFGPSRRYLAAQYRIALETGELERGLQAREYATRDRVLSDMLDSIDEECFAVSDVPEPTEEALARTRIALDQALRKNGFGGLTKVELNRHSRTAGA
jgi:hypothetical protein